MRATAPNKIMMPYVEMTPPNHTDPPVDPTASTSSPIEDAVAPDAAVGIVEPVDSDEAVGVSADTENAMRPVAIA